MTGIHMTYLCERGSQLRAQFDREWYSVIDRDPISDTGIIRWEACSMSWERGLCKNVGERNDAR